MKLQVTMPQHAQAGGGNRYPPYNTQQWMVGEDRQQLHQPQPHPFLRCAAPPSPKTSARALVPTRPMLCLYSFTRMTPSPNSGHPGISPSPGSLAPGVSGGSPSLLSNTPQPGSGYHQHEAESEEGKQVKPSALSSHAWRQSRMDGTPEPAAS